MFWSKKTTFSAVNFYILNIYILKVHFSTRVVRLITNSGTRTLDFATKLRTRRLSPGNIWDSLYFLYIFLKMLINCFRLSWDQIRQELDFEVLAWIMGMNACGKFWRCLPIICGHAIHANTSEFNSSLMASRLKPKPN